MTMYASAESDEINIEESGRVTSEINEDVVIREVIRYKGKPKPSPVPENKGALEWFSRDLKVCWGSRCKNLSPRDTAVILMLDVISQTINTGSATNKQLAAEYEIICEKIKEEREAQKLHIPQYLDKNYADLPALSFAKMVDRAINRLRVLFGVGEGRYFPIRREGTLENARWTWDDND